MNKTLLAAALSLAALTTTTNFAKAGHVYGGIIDTNGTPGLGAGDALAFVNNTPSSPDYGKPITGASLGALGMSFVTVGEQSGLYLSSAPSFTGLSNGLNWTGSSYRAASPFAALSGAWIVMKIDSISGPDGATFAFWEEHDGMLHVSESYKIGTSTGTDYWTLTDPSLVIGDGTTPPATTTTNAVSLEAEPPYGDPYGHLHGRSFTVDTPGTYTVSFILHDANGIQADSAPFVLTYTTAVPEPGTIALLTGAGVAGLALYRRRFKKVS